MPQKLTEYVNSMKETINRGGNIQWNLLKFQQKLGTTSDKIEVEVIEKGSTGFLGIKSKPAIIKARKKNDTVDNIREFLENVFSAMDMEVTIDIKKAEDDKVYEVELSGKEMGLLIGKRGQTLDSLQYLDTEDNRQRRKDTLENLAKNIAYKVKRTKRPVSLEPMNPFERRVIHSALQGDRYVETHSEGEEPFRHVVVTLKK